MNQHKIKNYISKGGIGAGTLYVVAIMLLIVGFSTALTNGVNPPTATPTGAAVTIVPPQLDAGKKNLQLYTFGYTTPAPTPTPLPPTQAPSPVPICTHTDGIKTDTCNGPCLDPEAMYCNEHPCNFPAYDVSDSFSPTYNCIYQDDPYNPTSEFHQSYVSKINDPNCVAGCFGKPVIYFYPMADTYVDVKLTIPGRVVESDPLYPDEGWQNVLAHPDGSLTYRGNKYKELYYESQVGKITAPDNGVVIPSGSLKTQLSYITEKLGLKLSERDEFLDYWMPKLKNLNSPYILFSLLDHNEKEKMDHVDIVPEPQTRIEFLVYFKPQQTATADLKPLPLPSAPPERTGFTSVEWGGTIAR